MAQITVGRIVAPKKRRPGLRGLADDWSNFSFDSMSPAEADAARADVPSNWGSPDYSATSDNSSLSSSEINWNSMLPSLIGAGVTVFKTQAAADVAQTQAGYGIAPAGYTYRGQAYNVQSSTGSSMPAGYNPVYAQSPYVGVAQAQSSGMSNTMLLLLLGGAAIVMMNKKK
jgi:hypothetical protein